MTRPVEPVTIIGAGISGAACAVALRAGGVPFRLVDRGRAVGGRMASPEIHGRRTDIGAGYFTVRDDGFADVVATWERKRLAYPWTDTFGVLAPDAEPTTSMGPVRWRTPSGLRSLVHDLLTDIPSQTANPTSLPQGTVVLAMPDPQAARLAAVPDPIAYDPAITIVAGFEELPLPFENAAFVNNHPVVEFVADDGARRGDGAPVLVAHTTSTFALKHLEDPSSATSPVVAAIRSITGLPAPSWTHAHRWKFAKPAGVHHMSYGLRRIDTGAIYFAGDQWSPSGPPRIESAWRSGTDVGAAICAEFV